MELTTAQAESQTKMLGLLRDAAAQLECTIGEMEWNEDLEVCCEVTFRNLELTLAKGWTDPGFRIFAWIKPPELLTSHPFTFAAIANHCATQGLALSPVESVAGNYWTLETVIYQSGFSVESFGEMVIVFEECFSGLGKLYTSLQLARSLEWIST